MQLSVTVLFIFCITTLCVCYKIPTSVQEVLAIRAEIQKACIKEKPVNPELIAKARKGEFIDDNQLKEYMFCVAKKNGIINDEGKLQEDLLIQNTAKLPKVGNMELSKQIFSECKHQENNGPDTTFKTSKCYVEKTKNNIY